jgi:hypothetical protein
LPSIIGTGNYTVKLAAGNHIAQARCNPGHACVAGLQTACQPGYFQSDAQATVCIACPKGMFAAIPGSIECVNCPAGYYGAERAAETPTCSGPCPARPPCCYQVTSMRCLAPSLCNNSVLTAFIVSGAQR